MKANQYFRIRKIVFFLTGYLFFLNILNSRNIPDCHASVCHYNFFSETTRGLEIRYIIIPEKKDKEKDEIIIDNVKYPLFKTKDSAIEYVTYAILKKDYTIVYVLTEKQKETEIIAIPVDND